MIYTGLLSQESVDRTNSDTELHGKYLHSFCMHVLIEG